MRKELQKKVDRAVKLIYAAGKMAEEHGQPLKICYSGGKQFLEQQFNIKL